MSDATFCCLYQFMTMMSKKATRSLVTKKRQFGISCKSGIFYIGSKVLSIGDLLGSIVFTEM